MSSENIASINRIYGSFEARDFAAFFSHLSPRVEIIQCPEVPWGGAFHGLESAKAFFEKVGSYLENHVSIERLIDGGDRVVVIGRAHGTVKRSGHSISVPIMHLWEFQNGLVVRLEIVLDVPTMQTQLAA
jgi:ketosteroid isomerase-like protein